MALFSPQCQARLHGLPVSMCGPKVDSNALQQSYRHELVLLSKWDRRLVFQDECIAAAVLWRNIAENKQFAFVAGTAVRALPKLQCAACCAALFEARLVYRRSWLLVYCSLPIVIIIIIIKSSSNHHQIIIKSSSNHHQIIIKSSSNHHQIIIKSSSNHHKNIIKSSSNHHQIIIIIIIIIVVHV